ncbi:MAG: glycosyltransferase family 2 protein [Asgard group archaeon]|nr:glycosyltransferase family 2 protein [Asgard group archaeon]
MSRKTRHFVIQIICILTYLVFLAYFGTSIASLVVHYSDLKWYGVLINVLVLICEMIGPTYAIYFLAQLLDGINKTKEISYDLNLQTKNPKVAVMIPVRNAHPQILKETLEGFKQQSYPTFEIWVGDDNSDKKYSSIYQELCNEYEVKYYYGQQRSFKSGILNKLFLQTDAELIAFFDVDQIPAEKILDKFVAVLDQNPEYVFVQAKMEFRKSNTLIHAWEMISYYQLACAQSGKMNTKTVIWHGCNACFKREFAYPIPEGKLSEDYDHTINLLKAGHIGCWLGEIGSYTLPTDTFDHKMSQLFRWTTGQVGAVMDHTRDFFRSKTRIRQSGDLFISSTLTLVLSSLYFVGILYAIMYGLKIEVFRALGLDDFAMIIVPILIGVVFVSMFTATSVYSIKNSENKIGFINIVFFLLTSSIVAPFLLVPTFRGLFRKNKLDANKKNQWNRPVRLYLISSIFTLIGLGFGVVTIYTILDMAGIVEWYPHHNYFFVMFLIISFMLIFSMPFVIFMKIRYKESPLFQDENVYI